MTSGEPRKCYGYSRFGRVMKAVVDILIAAFFTPFLTMPIWMAVIMIQERTLWPHAILLSLISTMLSVIIATAMLNQAPEICISDNYLEVTMFTVLWIRVPWADVTEIRQSQLPSYPGWVIVARKVTPLHYVLGWLHLHSFTPAVPIPRGIRNFEDLLREIRRRSGAIIAD